MNFAIFLGFFRFINFFSQENILIKNIIKDENVLYNCQAMGYHLTYEDEMDA